MIRWREATAATRLAEAHGDWQIRAMWQIDKIGIFVNISCNFAGAFLWRFLTCCPTFRRGKIDPCRDDAKDQKLMAHGWWLCLGASGRTLFCLGRGFKEGLAICGQTWVITSTWTILTPVIAARSTSPQRGHTIRGPLQSICVARCPATGTLLERSNPSSWSCTKTT